jgi:predicted transcriptional regulator
MIDFACKKFDLKEIIRCSFGISRSDFKLFEFLLVQSDEMTTAEISKAVSLDRTTVQKSIKKLVEKEVVKRLQINLERGGYLYRYQIKDKDLLKRNIIRIIRSWADQAEQGIKDW